MTPPLRAALNGAHSPTHRPASERSSLLPSRASSPPRNTAAAASLNLNAIDAALDSDVDSAGLGRGAVLHHAQSYGSISPASRQDQAFASLPARLSRAKSIDRKRERKLAKQTKWQSLSTRVRYYVPVLDWLPRYSFRQFGGDVTAALTLTSLLIPQSMSYATALVHTDPVYGLFASAIPAMLYSVLGTCRQLSVGPEAALSLITGEMIARFVEEEEHAHGEKLTGGDRMRMVVLLTTMVTFQSGLVTFLLGFFRLGFLDAVLSRALLRGFMTAVGLVIFVTQAVSILGIEVGLAKHYGASSSLVQKVYYIFTHLSDAHRLTLIVSSVALGVLVGTRYLKRTLAGRRQFRFLKFIPEVLVVVLVSTLLSHLLNWNAQGLSTLGLVSPGSVKFRIPFLHWRDLFVDPRDPADAARKGSYIVRKYAGKTFGTATVVAVLGFLDSIVAAKDQASKHDYPVSPNRELCALGFANLFASFCTGSLQGYGSITRSRLAAATGATTQMASLLTGVFVLTTTYTLLGYLESLPKCILAVVVCVVVFSILEEAPHDVKFFWKMRAWVDGALMLLTFFLSLFVNVEVGIIVSVALSMVLCIKQSTHVRINLLARIPGTTLYEPISSSSLSRDDEEDADAALLDEHSAQAEEEEAEEVPGVLIARIRDVALTFANTGALKERLRRLERYGARRAHPADEPRRAEASVVVFHLADVQEVDASAAQILGEVVESYCAREAVIYFTNCQPRVLATLKQAGVIEASGGDHHVQPTVQLALQELHENMAEAAGPAAADSV
ncbi:hypothetical protein JCM6882_001880 [Rhodosporidiobolus microsporus]